MQHPLLGSVDPLEGPDVLDERERELVHVPESPAQVRREDLPTVDFPAPEVVPQRPSVRRIARRILAGGLRRLSQLADKIDRDE